MRTPVAVLKAQIEAMQDGIRPLDLSGLNLLQTKVEGLNTLVDDLFELTLSDIGALNYQKKPVVINELIALCVEQFQSRADDSGLTLQAIMPKNSAIL